MAGFPFMRQAEAFRSSLPFILLLAVFILPCPMSAAAKPRPAIAFVHLLLPPGGEPHASPAGWIGRLDRALRARLPELRGLSARTAYAQSVLLAFQCRENPLVETAADALLYHRGTATVSAWAHELFISSRQLERLLGEYWGMTPKKGSALVRYQALYQEICRGTLNNVQDAVARYGFADQAHLCREFRRYHGENVSHFFKTSCENGHTMEENGVYPPEEAST